MKENCNRKATVALLLVIIHFVLSVIETVLFIWLDTTILTGFVGAASPLMCFISLAYGEDSFVGVYLLCTIIVSFAIIVSFVIAILTKKTAVYCIGIISDIIVRVLLIVKLLPEYWKLPIAWTGIMLNMAICIIIFTSYKRRS